MHERVSRPSTAEGEPAGAPPPPRDPPPPLPRPPPLALAKRAGNAGFQRALLARAPAVESTEAYDTVAELLAGVGGTEVKPPYTSAKYQRAVKFLAVAGYDQIQEVFRGLEQRGGFQRLMDWLPFAEGVDWKRIRIAMQAWTDRNRTSRGMLEIAHRKKTADRNVVGREIFLGWIGLEAGDVSTLKGTKGFQSLSQAEQDRLMVYVGGSTSGSSGALGEVG